MTRATCLPRRARRVYLIALALGILLLVQACQPDKVYRQQAFVFGTLVEIRIWGAGQERARAASQAVLRDFDKLHEILHAWKPGALGRVNQLLATTEWATVSPSTLPIIEQSKRLYSMSDGLFNPAIGRLIALWGFQNDGLPEHPPQQSEIDKLLAAPATMDQVLIDGIRIRASNPSVRLDLGGIGKGYAIDLGIQRLEEHGIHSAIINAGGDLHAIGGKGERPWVIGIRHPRKDGILATVATRDNESVFTSGDYERFFEHQGSRYHHILDPRTGRPARGVTSVTVIHHNATEADAASTALFIAGADAWHAVARKMGIRYVMLVSSDGTVHMNPAMAERIHFEDEPPAVVVSGPLQ
jgi:thiamine biosynthesis lipoprotein